MSVYPASGPYVFFVFYFKSMCCVFESFNLVDMNLVASSNRQWTWVSVGLLQMDIHTVYLQAEVPHEASAVPGCRFCLRAHRFSSSRGIEECTISRWDSMLLQRWRHSSVLSTNPLKLISLGPLSHSETVDMFYWDILYRRSLCLYLNCVPFVHKNFIYVSLM